MASNFCSEEEWVTEDWIVDRGTRVITQRLINHYAATPSGNPREAQPRTPAQWHQLITESGIEVQEAAFAQERKAVMVRHVRYGWLCVVNRCHSGGGTELSAALCIAYCQFLMAECPMIGEGCPPAVEGIENDILRHRIGRQVAAGLCCAWRGAELGAVPTMTRLQDT